MTTEKCGCDVQFTARVNGEPVIVFCALHSSAAELLEVLRGLTETYQKAKQAIANAHGWGKA